MNVEKLFKDLGAHGAKLDTILAELKAGNAKQSALETRLRDVEVALAELRGSRRTLWGVATLAGIVGGLIVAGVAALRLWLGK